MSNDKKLTSSYLEDIDNKLEQTKAIDFKNEPTNDLEFSDYYCHDRGQTVTKEEQQEQFFNRLNKYKIDLNKKIAPPEVVWKIQVNDKLFNAGTKGNFSVIIGKAKSKKSFSLTLFLSDYLKVQKDKQVLYFDTEQSEYHVQLAISRLARKTGFISENIQAYHLRSKSTLERLDLIEKAIYNTNNVELVIIDGIRDLIKSINDEAEATMIADKLMKWTYEKNIHLITVLHQNKGDSNARGHVGTELMNKAELVLQVTKSDEDKNTSLVETKASRNIEIDEFAFSIDEKGLPHMVKDWVKPTSTTNQSTKKVEPHQIGDKTYNEILELCFAKNSQLKYSELQHQLSLAITKISSVVFSEAKLKKTITYLKNKEFIEQRGTAGTSKSFYVRTGYYEITKTDEVKEENNTKSEQTKIDLD